MARDMDGNGLRVGQRVGFKDDVEQSGKITRITGEMVTLSVWDSTRGCDSSRTISCRRVWVEE